MKYEVGKQVIGVVSGITEYGVFVKFDELYSGLIHISEISDKFVYDINDYVKIGDRIRVKILSTDNENNHLKLTIKNVNYKKIGGKVYDEIKETPNGFNGLKDKLPVWIEDYLKNKKN